MWPGIIASRVKWYVTGDPGHNAAGPSRTSKSDTCTDSLVALLSRCPGLVAPAFVALSVLSASPSSSGSLKTDCLCSFVSIRGWKEILQLSA